MMAGDAASEAHRPHPRNVSSSTLMEGAEVEVEVDFAVEDVAVSVFGGLPFGRRGTLSITL